MKDKVCPTKWVHRIGRKRLMPPGKPRCWMMKNGARRFDTTITFPGGTMRMRKFFCVVVLFIAPICIFFPVSVHSEAYPEFTGNYIECGGGWCDLQAYQLNTMMVQDGLSTGYAGFFEVPKNVAISTSKSPRILLYSGRQQADPRTTALVELGPLPYNDIPLSMVDGKNYKGQIKYSSKYVKNQLWIFKREVQLKFKPVEGKIGMFIYQPAQPLPDGFYVVDVGLPAQAGHRSLATTPEPMGFHKTGRVQTAMPFIVGKVDAGRPPTAQEQ